MLTGYLKENYSQTPCSCSLPEEKGSKAVFINCFPLKKIQLHDSIDRYTLAIKMSKKRINYIQTFIFTILKFIIKTISRRICLPAALKLKRILLAHLETFKDKIQGNNVL